MAGKGKINEDYSKLIPKCENPIKSENRLNGRNLSKPIMNSSLRHKNQIEHLKTATIGAEKTAADINKQKLTTKLNFGVHQKVFGDLTPINVNDSLLMPKAKLSIPKKYTQNNDSIPVPDLRDFLHDIPPLEYVVEEPEIKLEFIDYDFDVLLNYKLFKG